jgi:hypothetical protein
MSIRTLDKRRVLRRGSDDCPSQEMLERGRRDSTSDKTRKAEQRHSRREQTHNELDEWGDGF